MERKQKPVLHNDWIDSSALEVVSKLQEQGYVSYLVGGCVRDLLVGIHPKDFDIATDASPQQIKRCIRQSYIIGKRFRLVLVRRGALTLEVATFRRSMRSDEFDDGEEPFGDNLFGTPEQDALRRDFTVNALFYDPVHQELIDYSEGMRDIQDRILRVIGEPNERMIEDPIRILRALRLAHKIGFGIEPQLRKAMAEQAPQLKLGVLPRRREEYLKILRLPRPHLAFLEAYDLGLIEQVLPSLLPIFDDAKKLDIFLNFLHQTPRLFSSTENPVDLFTTLLTAAVRAKHEKDSDAPLTAEEVSDEKWLGQLMRDELGMFKYEQAVAMKALHLQAQVRNLKGFARKGPKRQISFLANESFPLAFRLAYSEGCMADPEAHFWNSLWQEKYSEIKARVRDTKPER